MSKHLNHEIIRYKLSEGQQQSIHFYSFIIRNYSLLNCTNWEFNWIFWVETVLRFTWYIAVPWQYSLSETQHQPCMNTFTKFTLRPLSGSLVMQTYLLTIKCTYCGYESDAWLNPISFYKKSNLNIKFSPKTK